jgi:hypothetical protein
MRAAKTVLATVLAALVIFGALGHRPAAAAGLPRFAAPRLVGHHSVTRAGTATVVTTVISKVFTALAAGAGKSLAQVIAQNDPALGWLLPAAAQRELLHTQQLKAVNDSLASLKQQVAGAQHQIAVDGFTNLVAHTHKVRSAIKEASDQLQELAELPANSRDAVQDAETLRKYIADNLLTAPEELNEVLAPDVPLASNPIEGASRLVMHRDRFFGPNSSAEVTSVYTVFAAYQTQLAVLLQNYYHATPGEFSPTRIQNNLKRLHGGNWQMPADGDMSKLLEGVRHPPDLAAKQGRGAAQPPVDLDVELAEASHIRRGRELRRHDLRSEHRQGRAGPIWRQHALAVSLQTWRLLLHTGAQPRAERFPEVQVRRASPAPVPGAR